MGDLRGSCRGAHVLMLNVFQKFQFTVSPLRQDRRAKGLHDLLHCDGDACELVLCGTVCPIFSEADKCEETITDQTRPNAPEKKGRESERKTTGQWRHAPIPTGCRSTYRVVTWGRDGEGGQETGIPQAILEERSPRMRSQRLRV